jgi:hypothetical protein
LEGHLDPELIQVHYYIIRRIKPETLLGKPPLENPLGNSSLFSLLSPSPLSIVVPKF